MYEIFQNQHITLLVFFRKILLFCAKWLYFSLFRNGYKYEYIQVFYVVYLNI
jgi:hypothetical protein